MLILLPPSEGKTPRRRGNRLDLGRLSFPELTAARERVLDALDALGDGPEALATLGVGPSLADEVARNTVLRTAPTQIVADLYTGVLYDALDLSSLDPAALRRARRWIVVQSALFGALRPGDRVPAYRLSMGTSVPGVGPLAAAWRPVLDPAMSGAAGTGLIVDCRSSTYAAAWSPTGPTARRWVRVVVPGATHNAKHTRGLVVRHLLSTGEHPRTPTALLDLVAGTFRADLHEPARAGAPWQLSVTAP